MPESSLENWDDLLREGLVLPPVNFCPQVMAEVARRVQLPAPVQTGNNGLQTMARWLAMLGAAAAGSAGLTQLAIFSFGIWSAGAAG